jgi:hypothetical protein
MHACMHVCTKALFTSQFTKQHTHHEMQTNTYTKHMQQGLDIEALKAHQEAKGTLQGFQGVDEVLERA